MRIRSPKDLGALVRDYRKSQGLNQTAFARKLGVTQSYISQLENGKRTLQLGPVLRILCELGFSVEIGREEPKRIARGSTRSTARRSSLPAIDIDQIVDG